MRRVIYTAYKPNSVLNVHKRVDGGWFWDKYSAFPYIGCYYGCEYCYWRDEKYNLLAREPEAEGLDDPFSQRIKIKINAPDLLRRSLIGKPKEIIYIDGYQPIESRYRLARKMLGVCADLNFPVFINEKSPLLLRDLDLIKEISRSSYLNVGFSIIFSQDDKTKKIFESRTPSINSRFKTMKKLSNNGITTGTVFMPILPLICDSDENIKTIVEKTKNAGGSYVLDGGLTLSGYCATNFYRILKENNEYLIKIYKRLYSNREELGEYTVNSHRLVRKYCKECSLDNYIKRPVNFYPEEIQINKKVAEHLYLKSREIMMTEGMSYRQFAFLKAAWTIDSLTSNIGELYEKKKKAGLLKLKAVGKKMSDEILNVLGKLTSERGK